MESKDFTDGMRINMEHRFQKNELILETVEVRYRHLDGEYSTVAFAYVDSILHLDRIDGNIEVDTIKKIEEVVDDIDKLPRVVKDHKL